MKKPTDEYYGGIKKYGTIVSTAESSFSQQQHEADDASWLILMGKKRSVIIMTIKCDTGRTAVFDSLKKREVANRQEFVDPQTQKRVETLGKWETTEWDVESCKSPKHTQSHTVTHLRILPDNVDLSEDS